MTHVRWIESGNYIQCPTCGIVYSRTHIKFTKCPHCHCTNLVSIDDPEEEE